MGGDGILGLFYFVFSVASCSLEKVICLIRMAATTGLPLHTRGTGSAPRDGRVDEELLGVGRPRREQRLPPCPDSEREPAGGNRRTGAWEGGLALPLDSGARRAT